MDVQTTGSATEGESRPWVDEGKLQRAFEDATESGKPVLEEAAELVVQEGDLVRVDYTATLEDGTLIESTLKDVGEAGTAMVLPDVEGETHFSPIDVLPGAEASIPGLADAILGMAVGENKTVILTPEEAYGVWDSNKLVEFPCVKKLRKTIRMTPGDYVTRFGAFPVLDKVIHYNPYLNARVVELTESSAHLELFAKRAKELVDNFGTAEVTEDGEEISVTLSPEIGAPFEAWNQTGKIVSAVGDSFMVDFNHPLAGQTVVLEVQVLSLTKASVLRTVKIPWLQDYDHAIAAAESESKPVLLVLYASWCGYCSKLFTTTMDDPRIKILRDRFVWLKIDSDRETRYKQAFEQKGYPLLVLMDSEGLVIKKISGYRGAKLLRAELDKFLEEAVTGRNT
jgi:FKBP-type peptidyl-prolyl cis-trans isomerase 2